MEAAINEKNPPDEYRLWTGECAQGARYAIETSISGCRGVSPNHIRQQ